MPRPRRLWLLPLLAAAGAVALKIAGMSLAAGLLVIVAVASGAVASRVNRGRGAGRRF
ncbi:MAG: hypothetical protein OJJ54_14540 [Pseudonocardia sp.]|nr:hypothetical protein [Pseudonocardia sp.]